MNQIFPVHVTCESNNEYLFDADFCVFLLSRSKCSINNNANRPGGLKGRFKIIEENIVQLFKFLEV